MTTTPVLSITDEQIAEIRDYYAVTDADTSIEVLSPDGCLKVAAMATEILDLRTRLRAAEKDAGRYQWIKECGPEEIDLVIENPGDDLDAAIDTAMTEAKP